MRCQAYRATRLVTVVPGAVVPGAVVPGAAGRGTRGPILRFQITEWAAEAEWVAEGQRPQQEV